MMSYLEICDIWKVLIKIYNAENSLYGLKEVVNPYQTLWHGNATSGIVTLNTSTAIASDTITLKSPILGIART